MTGRRAPPHGKEPLTPAFRVSPRADTDTVDTFASRNYTRGPLVRPDTILGIQISLQNLGQSFGHQVNILGDSP